MLPMLQGMVLASSALAAGMLGTWWRMPCRAPECEHMYDTCTLPQAAEMRSTP